MFPGTDKLFNRGGTMYDIVERIIAMIRDPTEEAMCDLILAEATLRQVRRTNRDANPSIPCRQTMDTIARVIRLIKNSVSQKDENAPGDLAFSIHFDLAYAEIEGEDLDPKSDAWLLDILEEGDLTGYGYVRRTIQKTNERARKEWIRTGRLTRTKTKRFLEGRFTKEETIIIFDRIHQGDRNVIEPIAKMLSEKATLRPGFNRLVEKYSRNHATSDHRA